MDLLTSPIGIAAGAGLVVIIGLVVVLSRKKGSSSTEEAVPAEVARHVKAGNFSRAAQMAVQYGKLNLALDYYLRAQQPEAAAGVAVRMGNVRQAAELFERAGAWQKAVTYYERAGLADKAKELRRGKLGEVSEEAGSATAGSRAAGLELEFRTEFAKKDRSEAARAKLQTLARAAADALLAEGDIARAADVYRDAELYEEAVHLYVNVLGQPGQAAPILSKLGNHQRAAELYEMAGETERAASTWVGLARGAKQPEQYLERIERLSKRQAEEFLEEQTSQRSLAADTAELYYHLARLLGERGEVGRATEVFTKIEAAVPGYKDAGVRLQELRSQGGTQLGTGSGSGSQAGAGAGTGAGTRASSGGLPLLSPEQLQTLADQVAKAAAEQLKKSTSLDFGSIAVSVPAVIRQTVVYPGVGLEGSNIALELAFDSAVQGARQGASVDTLNRFTGGRPCDLGNIEVYYRLGLAHMATGNWEEAAAAFEAVEEASPGYRDAWKRIDEIQAWKSAMGAKRTMLGGDASTGGQGRYELRGELGRGGMAIVYRGYDTVLGREVALKFLSSEMSANADVRDMFQREGRAVAQLNHPNIVTIHDVGVLDGRAFLCMEFVEGKSVEGLMTDGSGLTIVESLQVASQVLSALAYAHSRKIIHRDIKPANFMRTTSGLVKLMDFGLAKSVETGTQQSMIAGTPQYMAPEQLRGDDVDHRADLFSVAVAMYELLTGHLPFEGMERHSTPRPPTAHVPEIPEVLSEVVMQGLRLDRNARWQTAEEMRAPIADVLAAVQSVAGGGEPVPAQTQASPKVNTFAATELIA